MYSRKAQPGGAEKRKRVLIVDDDKWLCDSLTLILNRKERGLNIHLSLSGKGALDLINREGADLLIVDYSLPDMSGIDLLTQIRKKHAHLPVIFMTGYGSEMVFMKAFKLGISDYFIKPIRASALQNSVREILEKNDAASVRRAIHSHPSRSPGTQIDSSSAISHALSYMKDNYGDNLSLDRIAGIACLSRSHFIYKFKKEMGLTFKEYLNHLRIRKAEEALCESDKTVSQIAHTVGFNSLRHFERVFKQLTGKTPCAYRKDKSPAIET